MLCNSHLTQVVCERNGGCMSIITAYTIKVTNLRNCSRATIAFEQQQKALTIQRLTIG